MSVKQHNTGEVSGSFGPPAPPSENRSVVSIPDICGGEPCIERTRIPVWILYRLKQLGATDRELMENYPDLSQRDLNCAWDYVASHQSEIDQAVHRNGN